MKKIHLYLCGGLGNQLFEYAVAKNLAIKHNLKLFLDTKTGFITDFRDATKFSLKSENLKDIEIKTNFFFLFYRILKKFIKINKFFNKLFNITIIDESNHSYFDKKLVTTEFKKKTYLIGYFQSNLYFKENEDKILQEIFPKKPSNQNYIKLKEKISKDNSVSIGVRMHENINKEFGFKINQNRKKKMVEGIGGITPVDFYLKSITKIEKKIKNPEFFIFSTKNSNIYKIFSNSKILEKYPITFITADDGYDDAYDNLWLMSYCKNFIISNSTLYWWGAYFSKKKYKSNYVLCSPNFPNKDTCISEWEKINENKQT